MKKINLLIMGIIVFVISLVIIFCLYQNRHKPTEFRQKPLINIGAILPLSGGMAQMGESALFGALMAIDDLNKESDNKYIYQLTVEDGALDPKKGVSIYNRLKMKDSLAAVLSYDSGYAKILKPLVAEDKILHLSGAIEKEISDGVYTYLISFNLNENVDTLAKYMKEQGIDKLYVVGTNIPAAHDVVSAMNAGMKQHGILSAGQMTLNSDQRDFKMEAEKIIKAQPDAVFLFTYEPILTLLPKQLRQSGFKGYITTFFILSYSEHKDLFENQFYVDKISGSDSFMNTYQKRFHQMPLSPSPSLYDSVMIIGRFIEQYGLPSHLTPLQVQTHMNNLIKDYQGQQGPLFINNGVIYPHSVIKRIENAQPVVMPSR